MRMAYIVLLVSKHKIREILKYGCTLQAKKLYPGENVSPIKMRWGKYTWNLKGSSSPHSCNY